MMTKSEFEATRAAILAYIDNCKDNEKLGSIIAIFLEGKTLADLPYHLRAMFEEISVAGVTVLALKP